MGNPITTSRELTALCDMATEAHARIQRDYQHIDPIVGVSQGMRASGIPADALTIDCPRSGKRIIVILHDQQPELVRYQFSFRDRDPERAFEQLSLSELSASTLYDWIREYF